MGISHEAYVAYGVHVAVHPYRYDENGRSAGEQVDQALAVPTVGEACPDVGHLQAGAYDRDMFFLVTKCDSAEPGEYTRIGSDETPATRGDWNRQLTHFLEVMGWTKLATEEPGWFVIADES